MKSKIEQEFIALFDSHIDPIFRYAYFRVYDRELAKDLAQKAFIKTWKYLVDGHEVDNLRALLYRITKNLIIDYHRTKKVNLTLDELPPMAAATGNPESKIFARLDINAAIATLHQLNPDQAEIILLRYVEGLGPQEIGQILDKTPNAVSVQINRAKKELKKILS